MNRITSFFNKQIKNYVLRNQKLASEILAAIHDKQAKKKAEELLIADRKNYQRVKPENLVEYGDGTMGVNPNY